MSRINSVRMRRFVLSTATLAAILAAAIALYALMGQNFQFLPRGYAQHLYAVSTLKSSSPVTGTRSLPFKDRAPATPSRS